MSEFHDLAASDLAWWLSLQARLQALAQNDPAQTALLPVDDLIGARRYVACPRRGTHERLTECWMCWCDCAWGYATAAQVLRPVGVAAATNWLTVYHRCQSADTILSDGFVDTVAPVDLPIELTGVLVVDNRRGEPTAGDLLSVTVPPGCLDIFQLPDDAHGHRWLVPAALLNDYPISFIKESGTDVEGVA